MPDSSEHSKKTPRNSELHKPDEFLIRGLFIATLGLLQAIVLDSVLTDPEQKRQAMLSLVALHSAIALIVYGAKPLSRLERALAAKESSPQVQEKQFSDAVAEHISALQEAAGKALVDDANSKLDEEIIEAIRNKSTYPSYTALIDLAEVKKPALFSMPGAIISPESYENGAFQRYKFITPTYNASKYVDFHNPSMKMIGDLWKRKVPPFLRHNLDLTLRNEDPAVINSEGQKFTFVEKYKISYESPTSVKIGAKPADIVFDVTIRCASYFAETPQNKPEIINGEIEWLQHSELIRKINEALAAFKLRQSAVLSISPDGSHSIEHYSHSLKQLVNTENNTLTIVVAADRIPDNDPSMTAIDPDLLSALYAKQQPGEARIFQPHPRKRSAFAVGENWFETNLPLQ